MNFNHIYNQFSTPIRICQRPSKFPEFPVHQLRSYTQDNSILPLVNVITVQFLVAFFFLEKEKKKTIVFQVGKESNYNYIFECNNYKLMTKV